MVKSISLRPAATLFLLLLLPAAASAQPAPAARTSADEDRALQLYQDARGDYEQGAWQAALSKLKEAWSIFPHPAITLKLADVHEKLGQPEEALAVIEKTTTGDPEWQGKLEVRRRALRSLLQQPLKVSVISPAERTSVLVDHRERRLAPFEIFLPRGIHVFEATAPGYRKTKKVVDVRGASAVLVRFDLQPLTGTVAVRSPRDTLSGYRILLDGSAWEIGADELGLQRSRPRTVRVGRHQIACWRIGQSKDIRSFQIREGEDVVIECRSFDVAAGSTTRIWAWASLGAGVGALAGGTALLVSYKQDLDKGERENLIVESNKHIFGGVLLGAGVGLGVLSYFLFAEAADEDAEASVTTGEEIGARWQLLPSLSPGGAGLGAGFRF